MMNRVINTKKSLILYNDEEGNELL